MGVQSITLATFKNPAVGGGGGPDPNPITSVFCCGFECGQFGTVGQHWTSNGNVSADTGTVRNGARSMRVNTSAAVGMVNHSNTTPSSTINVVRFYVRFATLPNGDTFLFSIQDGASQQHGVGFHSSSSEIRTGVGSSASPTLTANGVSVTTGVWYRVDVKIDMTSGTRTVDATVDGSACTQSTSGNTNAPNAYRIGSSASRTTEMFFDDVVISHTSGDYPIGAGYVNHFVPTSDGSHNTGTAGNFIENAAGSNITDATTTSYTLIDEVPMDDATPDDFINQAANGATNYVEHVIGPASGISTPTLGPRGIDVLYGYHAAATGIGIHEFKINDNGTEDAVQSFNAAGTTSTRYARKHYVNPPSAASEWTTASGNGNFNNLRTRFGYSSDANPDQYLDCVMVEAEFSE